MKKAKLTLKELLRPPKWVLIIFPLVVFSALIYIFINKQQNLASAYVIYVMSAYCLAIIVIPIPKLAKEIAAAARRKISDTKFGGRYINDLAFRGSIGIYQGMAVNFWYVAFRIAVGICYASVWFISMAVYYLILGGIRLFLVRNYRHCDKTAEIRCYRSTAWLLFLLNIPMGGMILLMVIADNGYSYPGYVIYISASYTFYTMIMSIINLVKFRRLGSPILSAAKVLNFIAAAMSVLGLQTAMIAEFSAEDDSFRRIMNVCTGTAVWATVIVTAVYMLIHSRKMKDEVICSEQVGK